MSDGTSRTYAYFRRSWRAIWIALLLGVGLGAVVWLAGQHSGRGRPFLYLGAERQEPVASAVRSRGRAGLPRRDVPSRGPLSRLCSYKCLRRRRLNVSNYTSTSAMNSSMDTNTGPFAPRPISARRGLGP